MSYFGNRVVFLWDGECAVGVLLIVEAQWTIFGIIFETWCEEIVLN